MLARLLSLPVLSPQMVQSLGFAVYRALDWGLDENEERELSPRLEQLIDLMTNSDSEDSGCATADEGYGGQEEEEEGGEGQPRSVRTFGQAMRCCAARLADPAGAPAHYQAVCRALFAETVELMAFLAKIRDAKEVSLGARWHHGPAQETACSDEGLGRLQCPFAHPSQGCWCRCLAVQPLPACCAGAIRNWGAPQCCSPMAQSWLDLQRHQDKVTASCASTAAAEAEGG